MPIETAVWKLGSQLEKIASSVMEKENTLEDCIAADPSIVDDNIMIIGRQVVTAYGGVIDLLAIDSEGDLVVIELKRGKTPREAVAQLLDYASWVTTIAYDQILQTFAQYQLHYLESAATASFEQAFFDRFEANVPETVNTSHRLILVASELDASSERIVDYLADNYGVPVNAALFQHFADGGRDYLMRTWLRDPMNVDDRIFRRSKETWNERDYYVSLGEEDTRSWDDCMRYGFVSAGGGRWYTKTLFMLNPEARVFACIPKLGYVGVGVVERPACRVTEFTVNVDGNDMPILDAPLKATEMGKDADNPELCEYLVGVRWIRCLPREQAIWEQGMFANQNSVCRLRSKFTLERLLKRFDIED